MKEMNYTAGNLYELLHSEKKGDYNIAIVSYGAHPCAYVSIPPTHPFYKKYYDDIDISCHCGLTFSNQNNLGLEWAKGIKEECSWIGWDYAHCDDYSGYYQIFGEPIANAKKWTTQEILEECYDVIEQLEKAKPCENCEGDGLPGTCATISSLGRCRLEYRKHQEPSSEDMEEELNRWRHEHFHGRRDKEADGEYLERLSQLDIARHFANWQKEQMKKWALEGVRTEYPDGTFIYSTKNLILDDMESRGILDLDKVKLIVIKED